MILQVNSSKSVYDFREKNNLSICVYVLVYYMVAYETRKVTYEKVQLIATLGDSQSPNLARKNVMNGNL